MKYRLNDIIGKIFNTNTGSVEIKSYSYPLFYGVDVDTNDERSWTKSEMELAIKEHNCGRFNVEVSTSELPETIEYRGEDIDFYRYDRVEPYYYTMGEEFETLEEAQAYIDKEAE